MTQSHQNKRKQTPRNNAVKTSALAAGLLVVVVAFIAVFWSEFDEAVLSAINEADDSTEVDVVEDNDEASSTPIEEADDGTRYVEADVGFPTTLNPLLASGTSERSAANLLYRSLLSSDESGDPAADLATDWDVSSDGLTYTLELDTDAEWHDGEPITVTDVLFTISLIRDADFPGDRTLARFWRAINVEHTGDNRLQFELMEPYIGFVHYLRLPILPKHEFGDVLPSDLEDLPLEAYLVGSGPFRLDEVRLETGELGFTRVEDEGSGFQEIAIRYFENRDEAVAAFSDGEVDGLSFVPLDVLHEDGALPGGSHIYGPELAGYTALYFNIRHPHFRDAETRRAIEAAIDREALVESVLGGHAIPGQSPIPRMSSAHAPGEHLDHDPELAEALLERAGWTIEDGDDVRQRDGEHFLIPLIVNSDDPQRVAIANLIQEQLRDVGISVDVQVMARNEVQNALTARQFTAVVYGWHTENGSLDGFQLWHSSQGEDGMNFTGFADAEADDLLLEARRSGSIEDRNRYYADFQKVFADQVPAVVLFYPRYHYAVTDRVQGAEPVPLVNPTDRIQQVPEWFAGERPAASE